METLSTTRYVELVKKKEFATAALDLEHQTYVIHIAFLSFTPLVASFGSTLLDVYPPWRPQISGLIVKKTPTKVPNKYTNFADVFSLDLASKLLKHTRINNHAIKVVDNQ